VVVQWGLALESSPLALLDERFVVLFGCFAQVPVSQLVLHKQLINQALWSQGLAATQLLGVTFDGIARHTPEGYAFQERSMKEGFKSAVRSRDEPFGDVGPSTFKG